MSGDLLTLELVIREKEFLSFTEMVKPRDVEELANRIDRIMFGKKGSLAKSIKAQSRPPESWKPLSDKYRRWKVRMKASGAPIAGENPPNKVISDKIWIRTGKVRQFTETTGSGEFKTVRIFPDNLFSRRPFYEAYINNVDYWKWPDKKRRLFFFTPEDKTKCQEIFAGWGKSIISRSIGGAHAARAAGPAA